MTEPTTHRPLDSGAPAGSTGGVLGRGSADRDPADRAGSGLDVTRPHPARRYNYWLGGKDNFAVDRRSGDEIAAAFPHVRTAARQNRAFLHRVVHVLAAEYGVREFLDIGTGLPAEPHVHDIAAATQPEVRVVYVDNDPLVMVHARALKTAQPPAVTAYIQADLRDPDSILTDPTLRTVIDLEQPVALLVVAVLHFLPDRDQPGEVLRRLVDGLPAGSYLALSHATFDPLTPDTVDKLTALSGPGGGHGELQARSRDEIATLLTGLDVIEPGLVPITEWRPDAAPHPDAVPAVTFAEAAMYGAVACRA